MRGRPSHFGPDIRAGFWKRVVKTDVCWTWSGHRIGIGYGRVSLKSRGHILTHRLAWELEIGPIPDGLFVLHRCDNPPCVRPDHLFLGTIADNSRDMMQKGRYIGPDVRGEKHGMAKLTGAQVLEIRQLATAGTAIDVLAKRFGVTNQYVKYLAAGKGWKHLALEAQS